MEPLVCPFCGLHLELEKPAAVAVCPSCYNRFSLPKNTQWTALIVPILVIHQFMLHVL